MCWAARTVRAAALACLIIGTGPAAFALDPPEPPVLFPDDAKLQRAYEDGFTTGYSVGADDGFVNGRQEAREQDDLRDEVADEAEQEPVEEGGQDLGDEITPEPSVPTPTSDSVDETSSVPVTTAAPDAGGGIPWWPLAFAVATTAWFVTRRHRRSDDQ
jgi:hypothetical protein